jgi:hypothetical protein
MRQSSNIARSTTASSVLLSMLPLPPGGAPPPTPQPHPSARIATASLRRRRMARGQRVIEVRTLAFAPVKRAVPV